MTQNGLAGSSLRYRADIDGLRAVAVLSVVFYHLGLPVHGGYIGVDIFFTISGFLIGSIILRQTSDGTFTFGGFYERRIRRIVPALVTMLLVTAVVAYRFLLPVEFTDFAKSFLAASFSFSNFYFWQQSGYFDIAATAKPLLHTWSLSVEEQFYIAFPLLLVFLRRFFPKRIELSIVLLAIASFLLSVYSVYRFPAATFYLAPSRAWELLLGTILALKRFPQIQSRAGRNLASLAGMLLILVPLWYYRPSTPFPGLAALPPCLGTALIIAAGRHGTNLVSRLLSLAPIRFIGIISYSLYLWHWPVIVFNSFGLTFINGLDHHQTMALEFAVSLTLALLSWRFIETPFRSGVLRAGRRVLFPAAAFTLVLLTAIGTSVIATHGASWRFSTDARSVATYLAPVNDGSDQYRNGTCFITSDSATLADFPIQKCLPDEPGKPAVLVLGDSHAAAMWWGLEHVYPGLNVMQATASGCKPVLTQRPRQHQTCAAIMTYALTKYLPTHTVRAVLIEAHWDDGDLPSLGEALTWLRAHNIPVILCGPIVQYDSQLPRLLAMSISRNDPMLPTRHRLVYLQSLDMRMQSLAAQDWHVPYVSMIRLFCKGDVCTEYARPGVPLQSDYGHLTEDGSVLAAQRIAQLGILRKDP